MLWSDGFEHGRLFHHVILISLSLIFFASLVLLILSIYYYELVIGNPFFNTTQIEDGA
jgi:hypothetical protein